MLNQSKEKIIFFFRFWFCSCVIMWQRYCRWKQITAALCCYSLSLTVYIYIYIISVCGKCVSNMVTLIISHTLIRRTWLCLWRCDISVILISGWFWVFDEILSFLVQILRSTDFCTKVKALRGDWKHFQHVIPLSFSQRMECLSNFVQ